jgi:hypothetical protein
MSEKKGIEPLHANSKIISSYTILLPPRAQLCIRYCSNKHTLLALRQPRGLLQRRLVRQPIFLRQSGQLAQVLLNKL